MNYASNKLAGILLATMLLFVIGCSGYDESGPVSPEIKNLSFDIMNSSTEDYLDVEPYLLASRNWHSRGGTASDCPSVSFTFIIKNKPIGYESGYIGDEIEWADGATGSVDFNAINEPEFSEVQAHLTNGINEEIYLYLKHIYGCGSSESNWLGVNPDLVGYHIEFMRLIVHSLSITPGSPVNLIDAYITWEIWGTILPEVISASINIEPGTLNLKSKSKAKWITGYIELPEGYEVGDIDVGTVMLEHAISLEASPTEIGDNDMDGIPDLMVKFDRQALIQYLDGATGEITLIVTGKVNETPFEGSDTIIVKN